MRMGLKGVLAAMIFLVLFIGAWIINFHMSDGTDSVKDNPYLVPLANEIEDVQAETNNIEINRNKVFGPREYVRIRYSK